MLVSQLLSLLPFSLAVLSQQIFIDRVPGYSDLLACVETPLSCIVGNLASGCGDGGQKTSFSCFCSASSTQFDAIIKTAVASKCRGKANATAEVAHASAMFNSYCSGINTTPTFTGTMAAQTNSSSTLTADCAWTPAETRLTIQTVTSSSPSCLQDWALMRSLVVSSGVVFVLLA